MKPLFIAVASAIAFAVPAQADLVLLPNLWAKQFCELRAAGVSEDGAIEAATEYASIDGTPIEVTMEDGSTIDADVIQALNAAQDRCPQFL